MAFPDFQDLLTYWNEFPPVHVAIRAFVRPKSSTWNNSEKKKPELNKHEELLLQHGNVLPFKELPSTIQDWLKTVEVKNA